MISTTSVNTSNQITKLPLMEHFYTIQGEGANAGRPAYFIRLGGCDVGCVWCDVKESWEASKHPMVDIHDILRMVQLTPATNVVITGGEPLMYDLTALTDLLQDHQYQVWLETSGAYPLTGTWNWICLSPKKFKIPVNSIYNYANELKIIVYNKSDFEWAIEHAEKVLNTCKLYLQPEWSKEKELLPLIIEFVKNNPQWTISLQTHKYLHIP